MRVTLTQGACATTRRTQRKPMRETPPFLGPKPLHGTQWPYSLNIGTLGNRNKHQLIANNGYRGNHKRVFLFPENELTDELIRRIFFRLHLSSTINFDKNYSTAKKFSYRQTIETTCALR